jgi:hypothetical protein
MDIHIHKHVSNTADGSPAMTSQSVWLIGLYKKNPDLLAFSLTIVSFISKLYVEKKTDFQVWYVLCYLAFTNCSKTNW